MSSLRPLAHLIACHIKGYLREPEAIFWTYGFPFLMVVGLGIAFSGSGQQVVYFDVVSGPAAELVLRATEGNGELKARVVPWDEAQVRLRRNQTSVVVDLTSGGELRYFYDPSNPEARATRGLIDDALQRAAGRQDPLPISEVAVSAPGSRYIDFLVPGLIGMNLMGGGMWGVGFVLVDLRIKKLLKRLLATPMSRPHFLLSLVGTRLIFFIPEAFFLLISAHLIFGVPIQGSIGSIVTIALLGTLAFVGMGLLAASRARRIETISGIMNVVMLPMWLCSGIFFSSERFPDIMQPLIQALPLTQLINALRAVILEGAPLLSQSGPALILLLWGSVSFGLALKWFRWH